LTYEQGTNATRLSNIHDPISIHREHFCFGLHHFNDGTGGNAIWVLKLI